MVAPAGTAARLSYRTAPPENGGKIAIWTRNATTKVIRRVIGATHGRRRMANHVSGGTSQPTKARRSPVMTTRRQWKTTAAPKTANNHGVPREITAGDIVMLMTVEPVLMVYTDRSVRTKYGKTSALMDVGEME